VTPEVLKRGVPLLLDATVKDQEFGLCFDALQRAAGSSQLGNFHYVPVLFHEAEMLSADIEKDGNLTEIGQEQRGKEKGAPSRSLARP
jgi:hypothetical protein